MTKKATWSLAEVTAFYSLVLFVIWGGHARRPSSIVIVLFLLGICLSSNILHKDSWERIGLSAQQFWPNLKLTLKFCTPFIVGLWLYAWPHRYEGLWNSWFSFLGYPFWAFVQEYTLLGFVANRLDDGIGRPQLVSWINGFLFGMAHLPNPVLMCVTFFSGVLFTHIFFRHRHLVPLSLVHAIFGVGISVGLGWINGVMSVGPGYYLRIGTLPY